MTTTPDLFDAILAHPDLIEKPSATKPEGRGWCPCHPDREGGKPSLQINLRKRIVKCFVCEAGLNQVAEAWGLKRDKPTPISKRNVLAQYDYRNAAGELVFQVVRLEPDPGEDKVIRQRRPKADGWEWNLKGVRTVLYRLPELMQSAPEDLVYIVEGEKDVNRLVEGGLTATTNPMGSGTLVRPKWAKHLSKPLQGREVVIIADNDEPGREHALSIAYRLKDVAASIRLIPELPDVGDKGDVSDYLDAGHTIDDLAQLAANTPPRNLDDLASEVEEQTKDQPVGLYEGSSWRHVARRILDDMHERGFFVTTGTAASNPDTYYFSRERRELALVDPENTSLRQLLNEVYNVNKADTLSSYLIAQMWSEAIATGQHATVAWFTHYDEKANVLYIDQGDGQVLRLNGRTIDTVDNGADNVVFRPGAGFEPWRFNPMAEAQLYREVLIDSLNFDDDDENAHTPDEQAVLMNVWLLCLAFENVQPTKPIALFVGPTDSGKTNTIRRAGKMLYSSGYQLGAIKKEKEGDFWAEVTNQGLAGFDNADGYIPWLEDNLATVSTGIAHMTRRLHTTNDLAVYPARCFVALSARTPFFRREDVASRMLIFRMKPLEAETRLSEREVESEVNDQRDDLLSSYVMDLNYVLAARQPTEEMIDRSLRLGDFAREYVRNGGSAARAYRAAYDADGMSDQVVQNEASKLLHHRGVSVRVHEIHEEALAAAQLTPELIIKGLVDIANDPNANANARVRALQALMKPLGMDVQRTVHEGTIHHDINPTLSQLSIEDLEALAADARQRLFLEGEGGVKES